MLQKIKRLEMSLPWPMWLGFQVWPNGPFKLRYNITSVHSSWRGTSASSSPSSGLELAAGFLGLP